MTGADVAKGLAAIATVVGLVLGVESQLDASDVPVSRWRYVALENCRRVQDADDAVEGTLKDFAVDIEAALDAQRNGIRETLLTVPNMRRRFVEDALERFPEPELTAPDIPPLPDCESVVD